MNKTKKKMINNIKFDYNTYGYDYTFKNLNNIKNDFINDLHKDNIDFKNKYFYKVDSGKRKDDLIQLINFSENLGLNIKK